MNLTSSRSNSGFTLLEVMIALAIVGTALVTCLGLTNSCLRSHEQVQRITTATMLAQHKMSELEAAARRKELDSVATQGQWSQPYNQYHWEITYFDTPVKGVQRVNVAIVWGKKQRNEEVSIDSFLFN